MRYKDAREYAESLRLYADFIEQHGHTLGGSMYITANFAAYLTATDYLQDEETGEWGTVLNEEKTKENIKKFLDAVGSCTKDWDNGNIKITKEFGTCVTLSASVSREVTCKKVPTGEKKVIPSYYSPERVEEEFEWVCEDVSLKKLVADV
jgi:hypothetical protein